MLSKKKTSCSRGSGPARRWANLCGASGCRRCSQASCRSRTAAPIRLRLLGEDLVAFRDTNGRLGILEAHCPHRRTHAVLSAATRNAGCAACTTAGSSTSTATASTCPSEPDGDSFKEKVQLVAYPAPSAAA